MATFIGLVAAFCTTFAFLPQVLKNYKSKSTKDVSLVLTVLMFTGVSLWLVYGLIVKDIVIIIANTASFIFTISLLILKIKYK